MAKRNLSGLTISLVLENGVSPTGKFRYKTMSLGKISPSDYFPSFPDLENNEELGLIYNVGMALSQCVSLGLSGIKEVTESRIEE